MPTPTAGFVYVTGIGVVERPGGTPTLYDGCDYNDGDVIIRKGVVTAFDPATLGVSDHDDLGNLGWAACGHTGTANRLAYFDGSGAAVVLSVSTGLSVSGGALTCTVSGTTDHTALSNLGWAASGHTGVSWNIPYFGASGEALVDNDFRYGDTAKTLSVNKISVTDVTLYTDFVLFNEAASRVLVTDSSKIVRTSSVTTTELGYLSGATSNIQTQINGLSAGMAWKASVRCASTTALTLSGIYNGSTFIDDVLVATGDRILLKNQSSSSENGIYVVGTSGPPTRATDADTSAEMLQATVFVREGTTLADTQWTCTNNTAILGTTGLTWAQVSGAGTYSAGSGITLTGNVFSISAGAITNAMLAGSIAASKLVGTDITTVGTVTTGTWHGSAIAEAYGGTGQSTYTLGDTLYASASNTLSKLAGQTTTYRKYLRQTGNGSASAAPAWDVPLTSDLSGALRVSGRLSLETGVPFSTSNQTAKTTVYWVPYNGNSIPIYDSTLSDFVNRAATEKDVPVPSTLFRGYDIFAYWTGSAVALETTNWDQTTATINAFTAGTQTFTTSSAHGLSVGDRVGIAGITGTCGTDATYGVNGRIWTVATVPTTTTFTLDGTAISGLAYTSGGTVYTIPNTRTTALATTNGIYTKSGDSSRTYLGSGMTTGVSGQTEMSFSGAGAKLLLWNQYNHLPTFSDVYEGSSHSYTTGAWRFWNGSPGNRIWFFAGQSTAVEAILGADCWGGAGYVAYAIDGVSGATPTIRNANASIVSAATVKRIVVSPGCHYLASVQYGSAGFNVSFSDLYLTLQM